MSKKFVFGLAAVLFVSTLAGSLLNKGTKTGSSVVEKEENKLRQPRELKVAATEEQLLGVLDSETSLRADIAPWFRSLDLKTESKNILLNVALADQMVFKAYSDKEKASKLGKAQNERVSCFAMSMRDTPKFAKILSELRTRIFNSQERVNAFHQYSRNRSPLPLDPKKTCSLFAKGKVNPEI